VPFSEQVMKLGSWSLDLDNCPRAIRREWEQASMISITPTWCYDAGLTRDELLAQSMYAGVVEGWDNERASLHGAGMLWWLGDADGIGDGIAYAGEVPKTWGAWLTKIVLDDITNGLTFDTYTGTAPTTTWPDTGTAPLPYNTREMIEELVSALAIPGYRVTPDGHFQHGDIFRTTPNVILRPDDSGRDIFYRSFAVADWGVEKDFERWANYVRNIGDGASGAFPASFASELKVSFDGAKEVRRKYTITSDATTTVDCNNLAAAEYARRQPVRTLVSVSVEGFNVRQAIEPGDNVYAWSLHDRLVDVTNQITTRGETIHPTILRCFGMESPIQEGQGVQYLPNDPDAPWIDLTPYIRWESGPTRLDVGSPRRSVFDR